MRSSLFRIHGAAVTPRIGRGELPASLVAFLRGYAAVLALLPRSRRSAMSLAEDDRRDDRRFRHKSRARPWRSISSPIAASFPRRASSSARPRAGDRLPRRGRGYTRARCHHPSASSIPELSARSRRDRLSTDFLALEYDISGDEQHDDAGERPVNLRPNQQEALSERQRVAHNRTLQLRHEDRAEGAC